MNFILFFTANIVMGMYCQSFVPKPHSLKNHFAGITKQPPIEFPYPLWNAHFQGNKARIHELLIELISLYEEELFSNTNPAHWDPTYEQIPSMYQNPMIIEEGKGKDNQESQVSLELPESTLEATSEYPWSPEDLFVTRDDPTMTTINEEQTTVASSRFPLNIASRIPDLEQRTRLRTGDLDPVSQNYESEVQESAYSSRPENVAPTKAQSFTDPDYDLSSVVTFLNDATEGQFHLAPSTEIPINTKMESLQTSTINVEETTFEPEYLEMVSNSTKKPEPYQNMTTTHNQTKYDEDPKLSSSTTSSHPVKLLVHAMKDYHKEMLHELISSCDNSTGSCPLIPTNKSEMNVPIQKTTTRSNSVPTTLARKIVKDPASKHLEEGSNQDPEAEETDFVYGDQDFPSAENVPEGQRVQDDDYIEEPQSINFGPFRRMLNPNLGWRDYKKNLRLFRLNHFQQHL